MNKLILLACIIGLFNGGPILFIIPFLFILGYIFLVQGNLDD